MAPVDFGAVLVVAVGGMGDQQVRALDELRELLDIARVVALVRRKIELVVRDVADAAPARAEPVAQTVAGMAEQHGLDLHRAEAEHFLAQVAEHQMRTELPYRHREIDALHLRADGALDGEIALVGPEDLDLVAADIERGEERHRVDMVPVRVRDEDARREALAGAGRHAMVGQALDARAAVEDVERLRADLHAEPWRFGAS